MMRRLRLPVFAGILLSALAFAHAQQAKFVNPPELSKPNGYSHVVVVNRGNLIIISGQTGFLPYEPRVTVLSIRNIRLPVR